jgi:hypothetical protein
LAQSGFKATQTVASSKAFSYYLRDAYAPERLEKKTWSLGFISIAFVNNSTDS